MLISDKHMCKTRPKEEKNEREKEVFVHAHVHVCVISCVCEGSTCFMETYVGYV